VNDKEIPVHPSTLPKLLFYRKLNRMNWFNYLNKDKKNLHFIGKNMLLYKKIFIF